MFVLCARIVFFASCFGNLFVGRLSPVRTASLVWRLIDERILASAGIFSPCSRMRMSPGTISEVGMIIFLLFLRTVAFFTSIFFSFWMIFSALYSWANPRKLLSTAIPRIRENSSHSEITAEAIAAAMRMYIKIELNCFKKIVNGLIFFFSLILFGPYFARRESISF